MSLFQAIVLGFVQGLTEFLPISSTAHLLIVPWLLGWDDPGAAFSAVIQTGTLLAVFVALRRDIWQLMTAFLEGLRTRRPFSTPQGRAAWLVLFGTLPIVVVGFTARDLIRGEARQVEIVITTMIVVALLMAAAEWLCSLRARQGRAGRHGIDEVTLRDGLTMGFAQVFALVPGTSRSGVTIVSGVFTGLDRATAARFSFLLSLPAITAAAALEAWQQREAIFGTPDDAAAITVGTLTALVVGYAAIRWLLAMLTRHTLWPFVVYRLALAAALTGMLLAQQPQQAPEAAAAPARHQRFVPTMPQASETLTIPQPLTRYSNLSIDWRTADRWCPRRGSRRNKHHCLASVGCGAV